MNLLISFALIWTAFYSYHAEPVFNRNKVIAHRGAWKAQDLPQNSIASLKHAVELGCEGSEFDVWMTADSVLVVNHDASFYGMPIETSTYADLLKATHKNGEKIPTVEEYLKAGMEQTTTKLIFEIKPSQISVERSEFVARKSVKTVQKLNAQKWVDYISFSYEAGLSVIKTDPAAHVAYLSGNKAPAELAKDGFFGFDYNINVVKEKPEWIQEAKSLGLTVNAWTVNKEADMKWLLDQHVDFITTDQPEILLALLKEK